MHDPYFLRFLVAHCGVIVQQRKAEQELMKTREAEKAARSYDALFNVEEDPDVPRKYGRELEDDFM